MDQKLMVMLVEAIPPDWSWIDGELSDTRKTYASDSIEEHTGLAVDRDYSIRPTIVGSFDQTTRRRRQPNLYALMVEQKLPGFVEFREAGFDAREVHAVNFAMARRLACGFLEKGYGGGLTFYKGCHRDNMHENSARCSMRFEPWHGARSFREESGPQPARVKLEWDERYRGKKEDIAPILAICRAHKLREYTPTAGGESDSLRH